MSTIDRRGATLFAADPPISTNPNPDLAIKAPVRVATTGANIALNGLQTLDGVALNAGDRVLVKDQADATANGLYNAQTGPWTRTIDANNSSQLTTGTQVLVATGTANASGVFKLTTANPVVVGTSALTWVLGAPPATVGGLTITPAASSINPGLTVNQNGAGTVISGFSYNAIAITDSINAGGNQVTGLSIFLGAASSSVQGPRASLQVTFWLVNPTNAGNPNRDYTAATFIAQAISNDGGGLGTEKGGIFGINPVATLSASASHMAECSGGEVNIACASGSSTLIKYGWKIVQESTDAVAGSVQDAALFMANQGGAVGWGTLWQIGDGVNANPLKPTGSIVALKGSPTFANGVDLSGAGSITGAAFKSPGFSVGGSGAITTTTIAAPASNNLTIGANGTSVLTLNANNLFPSVDNTASLGAAAFRYSNIYGVDVYSGDATYLMRTIATLTNGAGAQTATLTNAPAAGNPTKWIGIDDNGTKRQIPAW